ncbi:MAG: metallophosphoesterase [Defluviitaleaceae bacterium]|nr:metallophosphoesterase [Defluviitaleaceae bacterium]
MNELAKVKKVTSDLIGQKFTCISDIHGEPDLFKQLLDKINYQPGDTLFILGDLYTKGSQCHETLKYLMEFEKNGNIHILRGNCDWVEDYLSPTEREWLENLPDIIDASAGPASFGGYIFVHSGLESPDLASHKPATVKKYDNFLETATAFEEWPFSQWVVVGHWPVAMYCHGIPCSNPIVDEKRKIISIDGGHCNKPDGQLNAFIIENGKFSFESVDKHPIQRIEKAQRASGGNLSITWLDRFVEMVEDGEKLCRVKHLKTGTILTVPKSQVWMDDQNRTVICDMATDYYLPVSAGDTVSVVEAFPDRIFAKKDGISGWIML